MKTVEGRYVVAGSAIAGMATALGLARAGAEVVVVEKDLIPDAAGPEEAFSFERPGVPQSHFVHAFLGRMVKVLGERFPDVLADLEDAGARVERPPLTSVSEEVRLLLARRSTVEWVLRRRLLAESGVGVLPGRRVVGLEGAERVARGARLDDGTVVEGQVVACTGRRGDPASWLEPLGGRMEEQLVSSELIYFTRWYRAPGFDMGAHSPLRDLGFLSYLVIPSDGDTLAVAMALPPTDRELRERLLDPAGFDRVAGLLPGLGEGLAASQAEPLRDPRPMAGLVNRLRRYTDGEGAPQVAGFFAVGDAHTITNPAYGRGCSMALVQATLLADAVAAHPGDAAAAGAAYESGSAREVEPWFHSSVMMDQSRAARRAALVDPAARDREAGGGQPDLFEVLGAVSSGDNVDPVVLDGFARLFHALTTPAELFADPVFLQKIMALVADPPALPAPTSPALTREALLKTASAAA